MSFLPQPPPACAPRKQLVQVKTGTGTLGALTGMSAASAQDAILDSEITTVARSDSLIVESFVRVPTPTWRTRHGGTGCFGHGRRPKHPVPPCLVRHVGVGT